MKKAIFILVALLSMSSCSSSQKVDENTPEESKDMYKNPVIDYSLPDPTIVQADNGYYYLYATEDIRNVPIHRSKNLLEWEYVGTAFTENSRPNFEANGGIWAPDINKIGDKYVLYYSMSVWGGEWTRSEEHTSELQSQR